jgi:hypothetical protein
MTKIAIAPTTAPQYGERQGAAWWFWAEAPRFSASWTRIPAMPERTRPVVLVVQALRRSPTVVMTRVVEWREWPGSPAIWWRV